MNIEQVKVGQRVRIVNDTYTHSMLNGCEGIVQSIDLRSTLPVDVDIGYIDGCVGERVPFMAKELELIE